MPSDLPRNFDLTLQKKTPAGSKPSNSLKLRKSISLHEVKEIETDKFGEENLSVEDKQQGSPVVGPASTEQPTSLGQPRGPPTLLVKFFDLDEEEVHLAESLCGFDQEHGDLLGDLHRNGVKVGIYIKIAHCQVRGEVYELRDMLSGIKGTFCGSTITHEIRFLNLRNSIF